MSNSRPGKENGNYNHGMHGTKEYKAWEGMKSRCLNPNVDQYPNYGGRGIRICPEWAESFAVFYKDMGPIPTMKHSLDRIDCNGDYGPQNCKWSTPLEQSRNKRKTRKFRYKGQDLCLHEISEITGLTYACLQSRLYQQGLSLEEAVSRAPRYGSKSKAPVSRIKYDQLYEQCEKLAEALEHIFDRTTGYAESGCIEAYNADEDSLSDAVDATETAILDYEKFKKEME